MSTPDEYDDFFDDLPWDEVGKLLDAPTQPVSSPTLAVAWRPAASTSVAPVTRTPAPPQPSQRRRQRNEFRSAATLWTPPTQTSKRRREEEQSPEESLKKMKMYAQKVLKGFEEEFTCPICFDLIVACHLSNPCGHSACGSCAKKWASNKSKPTCFACRATMHRTTPFIPGLLVDNLIEKQINSLAENGDEEWQERGVKRKEWEERKAAWAKEKAKGDPRQRRPDMIRQAINPPRPVEIITVSDDDNEDEDEDEDEDEAELQRYREAWEEFELIIRDQTPHTLGSADIGPALLRNRQAPNYAFPRVSRRMLQRLPIQDNPRDADYVPDTQIVLEDDIELVHRPVTRNTRSSR